MIILIDINNNSINAIATDGIKTAFSQSLIKNFNKNTYQDFHSNAIKYIFFLDIDL